MQLALVKREELPIVWPLVRFKLKRAIDRVGLENFDIAESGVLNGNHLLWVAYDLEGIHAALTTQVTPDMVCTIVAFGGTKMKEIMPFLRQIEFYHRNIGCKAMRIIGRKGWSRVLPDYKQRALIMERQL